MYVCRAVYLCLHVHVGTVHRHLMSDFPLLTGDKELSVKSRALWFARLDSQIVLETFLYLPSNHWDSSRPSYLSGVYRDSEDLNSGPHSFTVSTTFIDASP